MSIPTALAFIEQLRTNDSLRAAFAAQPTVEHCIALAAKQGLAFTVADLQAAHRHDWAMRWLRYHR